MRAFTDCAYAIKSWGSFGGGEVAVACPANTGMTNWRKPQLSGALFGQFVEVCACGCFKRRTVDATTPQKLSVGPLYLANLRINSLLLDYGLGSNVNIKNCNAGDGI
jgi:hypothetical protein